MNSEMAESRGSLLAKSVQKHAGRAKEKLLQNLGKVDRTADDIFDEHLQNFTKQQNSANRLQKEFNNYLRAVRTVQVASKSLLEAVGDIYESQWSGHDLLFVQTQSVDTIWQDFYHKLTDQVCIPLNTYQSQFPEMRKKIDKRGRKLVDYDSQRHSFQALQLNMAKKRDDAKIARGREQLEEAKRTYEVLNSELHDELPALYDSRILFLVTNLQTLFNAEQTFHSQTAKVFNELEGIVDKLATESQRTTYNVKRTNGTSLPRSNENASHINNISPIKNSPSIPDDISLSANEPQSFKQFAQSAQRISTESTPPSSPSNMPETPTSPVPSVQQATPITLTAPSIPTTPVTSETPVSASDKAKSPETEKADVNGASESMLAAKPTSENVLNSNAKTSRKHVEELYDIPVGASTDNLPPGVLYRVKATYKYNREDVDELSFDVGEIIQVVEYDDPEEQEEGWLMGIKENNGEKGMFPANFTRPL